MVSAQIKGIIRFYRKTPEGNRVLLYEADVQMLGSGGSSDGLIANSQEKWPYLPAQRRSDKVMQPNDHLLVTFEPWTAQTTDASDGGVVLPLTLNGGTSMTLGRFDLTAYWDVKQLGDVALLAQETVIAERTVREVCVLGSDIIRAFVSIENNS